MNSKKRIYAKLIDIGVMIFVFLILTSLTSGSSVLFYMFTYPIVSIAILYVYFGVIGNYLNGSLGKKLVNLKIKNNKNDSVPNMFKLFIREPIVQISLILLAIALVFIKIYNILYLFFDISLSTTSLNLTIFGMLLVLISILYIAGFVIKHDWWNNKYRIED